MSRISMFLSSLAVLVIAVSLSGCGGQADSKPAAEQPATRGDKQRGEGKHSGHAMPASTDVEKALAELSAEDQATAENQQTCAVTDAALGSMGKPFKLTVQERDVFLCCEMCKDAVTDDPKKYMAKLSD